MDTTDKQQTKSISPMLVLVGFFCEHAGELRIIKLREENDLKWTKVQY
jgi:hypothetical protein